MALTRHAPLGYDVALFALGDPAAPSVVLLHGIGVSSRYFGPLETELSRDHRVLAPDLVGFGRSPRAAEPLSVAEHAEVVAALLDEVLQGEVLRGEVLPEPGEVGVPGGSEGRPAREAAGVAEDARGMPGSRPRPVVVGHSMGTQVAVELALRRPDLVGSLVLVGPVADPAARSAVRQGLRLALDAMREPWRGTLLQVREWLRTGVRWYLRTVPHMRDHPLEDLLPEVTQPVTIVRGGHDPVTPGPYARGLAGRTEPAAALVEVPGTGHLVHWERPDVLAGLCRRAHAATGAGRIGGQ